MRVQPGDVERLLAGVAPPEPPHGLQERVLRGAREALAREAGRDLWTRIWESRPLRVAWGLTVTLLVICNVGLTQRRAASAPDAPHVARSSRSGSSDAAAIERLPRLDEDARPLIGRDTLALVEETGRERPAPAAPREREGRS